MNCEEILKQMQIISQLYEDNMDIWYGFMCNEYVKVRKNYSKESFAILCQTFLREVLNHFNKEGNKYLWDMYLNMKAIDLEHPEDVPLEHRLNKENIYEYSPFNAEVVGDRGEDRTNPLQLDILQDLIDNAYWHKYSIFEPLPISISQPTVLLLIDVTNNKLRFYLQTPGKEPSPFSNESWAAGWYGCNIDLSTVCKQCIAADMRFSLSNFVSTLSLLSKEKKNEVST